MPSLLRPSLYLLYDLRLVRPPCTTLLPPIVAKPPVILYVYIHTTAQFSHVSGSATPYLYQFHLGWLCWRARRTRHAFVGVFLRFYLVHLRLVRSAPQSPQHRGESVRVFLSIPQMEHIGHLWPRAGHLGRLASVFVRTVSNENDTRGASKIREGDHSRAKTKMLTQYTTG